jgi:hypothetical protein
LNHKNLKDIHSNLPQLKKFQMTYIHRSIPEPFITDITSRSLAKIENLKYLCIESGSISESNLCDFIENYCPNLTKFYICGQNKHS